MPRPARRPAPKPAKTGSGYEAWVTVGKKPNGRPLRQHVRGADYDECQAEIDRVWADAQRGIVREPSRQMPLPDWIDVYLTDILPRRRRKPVSPDSIRQYAGWNRRWVRPHISTALARLSEVHLERLYLQMESDGLSGGSQRAVHFLIQGALEVARRRHFCDENVAKNIEAPEENPPEVEIFTDDERLRILHVLADWPAGGLRFELALVIATRQGETLGLEWSAVDYEEAPGGGYPEDADIRIEQQLVRRLFEHGCGQAPCGRKRGVDCPQGYLPLKPGERQLYGGLILKPPKKESRRAAPLPKALWLKVRAHRKAWAARKLALGPDVWPGHELMFVDQLGNPIDPKADREEWRAILTAAKVRYRKQHTTRHDGATRIHSASKLETAQEVLGHSSPKMTKHYSKVAEQLRSSPEARNATDSNVRELFG